MTEPLQLANPDLVAETTIDLLRDQQFEQLHLLIAHARCAQNYLERNDDWEYVRSSQSVRIVANALFQTRRRFVDEHDALAARRAASINCHAQRAHGKAAAG